jgi:hypothetical protein
VGFFHCSLKRWILNSPGICHPESLRFWQGEGSAFRLSAAIFPGSQQGLFVEAMEDGVEDALDAPVR